MTDNDVLKFLMSLAGCVVRIWLESRRNSPPSNAGPHFRSEDRETVDEAFARWMGWRGQEEQEREMRNMHSRSESGT